MQVSVGALQDGGRASRSRVTSRRLSSLGDRRAHLSVEASQRPHAARPCDGPLCPVATRAGPGARWASAGKGRGDRVSGWVLGWLPAPCPTRPPPRHHRPTARLRLLVRGRDVSKEVGVTGASTFPVSGDAVRSAACCKRRRRGWRESAWGERSQRVRKREQPCPTVISWSI